MNTTTLIKDSAIDRYQRQLERDALDRIGLCSIGYRRAAQPFIVEHRSDNQVRIRDGWREAMQQQQVLWALIHLVQGGSDRRPCYSTAHIVAADADGCAIAVCWPETLTWELLETLLAEAEQISLNRPIHIYGSACTAPIAPELYHFYHVADPWAPPDLCRHQLDGAGAHSMLSDAPADLRFEVEITATATVQQRRQIRAQTPEAALALAVASAGDHPWTYMEVDDDSIAGTATIAQTGTPMCSTADEHAE